MTGHMLGLGDRHGENIMIDCSTGDTVHVDFGCLFDRGLILEVPEMVPFRLTQNIVDCFGVTGVEGAYRKCAEVTLKVGGSAVAVGGCPRTIWDHDDSWLDVSHEALQTDRFVSRAHRRVQLYQGVDQIHTGGSALGPWVESHTGGSAVGPWVE